MSVAATTGPTPRTAQDLGQAIELSIGLRDYGDYGGSLLNHHL